MEQQEWPIGVRGDGASVERGERREEIFRCERWNGGKGRETRREGGEGRGRETRE